MKATFKTNIDVILAAIKRNELIVDKSIAGFGYDFGEVQVFQQTDAITLVVGCAHSIMRLIGELANDGQDCLLSVS